MQSPSASSITNQIENIDARINAILSGVTPPPPATTEQVLQFKSGVLHLQQISATRERLAECQARATDVQKDLERAAPVAAEVGKLLEVAGTTLRNDVTALISENEHLRLELRKSRAETIEAKDELERAKGDVEMLIGLMRKIQNGELPVQAAVGLGFSMLSSKRNEDRNFNNINNDSIIDDGGDGDGGILDDSTLI